MPRRRLITALALGAVALIALVMTTSSVTEAQVSGTLKREFPERNIRVGKFRTVPDAGGLLCGSASIDRYSYRAYAARRGLDMVVWLQAYGDDDPDLLVLKPTPIQRRYWVRAMAGCLRSGPGSVVTMAEAVVKGSGAQAGPTQLVEVAGRRLAIPAGNWDSKVFPADGTMIKVEERLILRGDTPRWLEGPLFTSQTGFGTRIRDLAGGLHAPPDAAYTRLRDRVVQHADIVHETTLSSGERHLLMKTREGDFNVLPGNQADVFVENRRRRLTVCSRFRATGRNDYCQMTVITGGLWHDLSYRAAYVEQRHVIADELISKLAQWEAAAARGGFKYSSPPDILRANLAQQPLAWMVR